MKHLLLIVLLSLASSCQKEDMPADGHKNIFRCKVNGVEWTPHCISDFFGCSAVDCQYYKDGNTVEIVVERKYEDNSFHQGIRIYSILDQSTTSPIVFLTREYTDWNSISGCRFYDLDSNSISRINIIAMDTLKFTIEGTFEFAAINKCQDTVRITDGYFDLEYRF